MENLTPDTTYYFAIKTYDELWNASPLSNIASATTPSGTPAPAAISNLTVDYAAGTSVRLDWTAPGDDYNTGTAAAYDLRYSTSPITEANWSSATPYTYGVPAPAVAGTSQSATVFYLNMLTTYYFAIKTVDGDGNWSPLSNVVSYRTLDDDLAVPATVGNLAASNPTANAVTLTWNASGDDAIFGTCRLLRHPLQHQPDHRGQLVLDGHEGDRRTDPAGLQHQPEHDRYRPERRHDLLLRHAGGGRGDELERHGLRAGHDPGGGGQHRASGDQPAWWPATPPAGRCG